MYVPFLVRSLAALSIVVPTGLRLGAHYFNTDDELRYAVEQIAGIVASGGYEQHLAAAAQF